jgi:hypothetical protein
MFPAVFLALPLLLPMSYPIIDTRVDFVRAVPMVTFTPADRRAAFFAQSGPVIPALYVRPDGGFSLWLLPGSPGTAACLRLQGTF